MFTRRAFVTRLLLASGFVGSLRRVGGFVTGNARAASEDDLLDPQYLEGTILSVDASASEVMDRYGKHLNLSFLPDARVWKGSVLDSSAVSAGDFFYAWGSRPDPQSFVVEKIWLNIANLRGEVARVDAVSTDLIDAGDRKRFTIALDPSTTVVDADGPELVGDFRSIHVGDPVQVIGVVERGSVRATRVFTH